MKKAATLIGVGPVTASAVVATVGEFKQFTSGAQFGAWVGLVPRQHSFGRQEQPGRHHQTRRHLPAQLVDPGGEVGGDDGAQAQRPDLEVGRGAAETAPAGRRRWWRWPTRTHASCGR